VRPIGKMKKGTWPLTLAVLLLLLSASLPVAFAQTPEAQPLPEATPLLEGRRATPDPASVSSGEVTAEGTGEVPG